MQRKGHVWPAQGLGGGMDFPSNLVLAVQACQGWAVKYNDAERDGLRDLLWAARKVLTESFQGGLPDARVGGDLLPLLLQGWRPPPAPPHGPDHAAREGCDFSGFHTAVLLSGGSLVSVGEPAVRSSNLSTHSASLSDHTCKSQGEISFCRLDSAICEKCAGAATSRHHDCWLLVFHANQEHVS